MSPFRRTPDWFDPDDPNRHPSRIASEHRAEQIDVHAGRERRRAWMWRGVLAAGVLAVLALWIGGVL